jgi:hypothetical protein
VDKSVSARSLTQAPDDVLAHYGIKGMKWGIRRKSSADAKPKLSVSADAKRSMDIKKQVKTDGLKTLSNKDLQDFITRKNLEKQYKQLKSEEASTMDRGSKHIQKALKLGKTINDVHNFLNTPAGKAIKLGFKVAGTAATVGAAYATGGTSAAAGAAAKVAIRTAANRYANTA